MTLPVDSTQLSRTIHHSVRRYEHDNTSTHDVHEARRDTHFRYTSSRFHTFSKVTEVKEVKEVTGVGYSVSHAVTLARRLYLNTNLYY